MGVHVVLAQAPVAVQPLPRDLQMKADVSMLASDLMGGRAAGSPFADSAAVYIAARMAQLGLAPRGDEEGFQQRFPVVVAGHGASTGAPALHTTNVVGYLDRGQAHTVVIGAHYDHLGFGGKGSGSLHVGDPEPHNGADDNASGIAVMLDLAYRLQQPGVELPYDVLFVAFSAEELGLVGSKYFVEHLPTDIAPVAAMINFDMVGRLSRENVLAVNGSGTSPSWEPLLAEAAEDRVTLKLHASGLGPSDHSSFYLSEVPVLHFFTGQHPQYHKPTDDLVLVNFAGMATVSDVVLDVLLGMPAGQDLAFAKTKDEGQREVATFKVTLGVMPDYVYAGTGMRIDAVLDDRPAEAAGLQGGDVLLELDGETIGDIYDYMEALGKHEKGERVNVVIERAGERMRKKVTF